jgi:hypothetical protein
MSYVDTKPKNLIQFEWMMFKIKIISCFTPYNKKVKYLIGIETKSRKIARDMGLNYAFFTFISTGQGFQKETVARIDCDKSWSDRHINIIFFSHMIMMPEKLFINTIFHEYCHFLYRRYTPQTTIFEIKKMFDQGKFPHINNNVEEDFCDLFSNYIVDNDTGDQGLNIFLKEFVCVTDSNLENENRMIKVSDMPATYLDPYIAFRISAAKL